MVGDLVGFDPVGDFRIETSARTYDRDTSIRIEDGKDATGSDLIHQYGCDSHIQT